MSIMSVLLLSCDEGCLRAFWWRSGKANGQLGMRDRLRIANSCSAILHLMYIHNDNSIDRQLNIRRSGWTMMRIRRQHNKDMKNYQEGWDQERIEVGISMANHTVLSCSWFHFMYDCQSQVQKLLKLQVDSYQEKYGPPRT